MNWPTLAFRSCMLVCAGLIGTTGLQSRVMAQDDAGSEEPAWHKERTKLEKVIDERVQEEIEKQIQKPDIAKKLGMKWPVKKPPKTKEQIAEQVEKEIEALAAKRFPESKRREFEKEAEEKYRIYERGDQVEFVIRGGMGPNSVVKGLLYDKTSNRLKVSGRYVLRSDMPEDAQARFWEEVSEEYKQKYIRVQNIKYDAKINAYKDELREDKLPQALEAARYVCHPKKFGSIKLKDWFAEHAVFEYFVDKRKKALEADLRPKITEQVFTSNGYVLVEDTVNNTKEWIPKKEEAGFRERLKALIEKKEEEKRAKEKPAGDVWGEPGMQGEPGMGEPGMAPPGAGGGGKGGDNPFDADPW